MASARRARYAWVGPGGAGMSLKASARATSGWSSWRPPGAPGNARSRSASRPHLKDSRHSSRAWMRRVVGVAREFADASYAPVSTSPRPDSSACALRAVAGSGAAARREDKCRLNEGDGPGTGGSSISAVASATRWRRSSCSPAPDVGVPGSSAPERSRAGPDADSRNRSNRSSRRCALSSKPSTVSAYAPCDKKTSTPASGGRSRAGVRRSSRVLWSVIRPPISVPRPMIPPSSRHLNSNCPDRGGAGP